MKFLFTTLHESPEAINRNDYLLKAHWCQFALICDMICYYTWQVPGQKSRGVAVVGGDIVAAVVVEAGSVVLMGEAVESVGEEGLVALVVEVMGVGVVVVCMLQLSAVKRCMASPESNARSYKTTLSISWENGCPAPRAV